MSDKEMATTPNPAKSVKFANPGQAGALFPAYQSRCSIQKSLLTKSLNSVKSSRDEFCLALEEGSALTTKKEKPKFF